MSKGRKQRMEAIKDILSGEEIESQLQLTESLKDRGFSVTQATVSRDMAELKVYRRTGDEGKAVYVLPEQEHSNRVFRELIQEVTVAQNLVLIKTLPGNASGVAAVIDKMKLSGMMGSVAGDDTILIVSPDDEKALLLKDRLRKWWSGT